MSEISKVAGIAWKLDYDDLEGKTFRVHWAWCGSGHNGKWALIKIPESWNFSLPPDSGFRNDLLGASETRGLLGGVPSKRLESLSEQCERAIGDVLTHAVCQIVDHYDSSQPVKILIFGPALPKMVGRFFSLRLNENVTIAWLCPSPFPVWIAQRADELLLVPQRHSSLRSADLRAIAGQSWEEEPLLGGFRWENGNRAYVVQYICNRPFDDPERELGLADLKGIPAAFAVNPGDNAMDGVWLPREIVATAGQVAVHLSSPYSTEGEMTFKLPPEAFAGDQIFAEGVKHQQNRSQNGQFVVEWNQKVAG